LTPRVNGAHLRLDRLENATRVCSATISVSADEPLGYDLSCASSVIQREHARLKRACLSAHVHMHRVRVANCRHRESKCVRKKQIGGSRLARREGRDSSVGSARSTADWVWHSRPELLLLPLTRPSRARDTWEQVHRHSGVS
jgi:hypothetical protein